jgi:flavodoxin/NAD-dependent dihydropyrimidine dehydrogenase PreA subunit
MHILIAYFSQTGSTRKIADRIKASFVSSGHEVTLYRIGIDETPEIMAYDVVGVGTPTHFFRVPFNVVDFIQSLPPLAGKSTFVLNTFGTHPGRTAGELYKLMEEAGGRSVGHFACKGADYWLGYVTRGYLFAPESPTEEELDAAHEFGLDIHQQLDSGQPAPPVEIEPTPFMYTLERFLVNRHLVKVFYSRLFRSSRKRCTGCGTCVKWCPTGNIHLENGRPKWGSDCLLCMACEMRCPEDAITSGIDWPVFAPFMNHNIGQAVKKGVPFQRVRHARGKTAPAE